MIIFYICYMYYKGEVDEVEKDVTFKKT
jgi:hypothetical protein